MPTVYREGGFEFFFWSNEREEPAHVHAESERGFAKFWLNPPRLAASRGLRPRDLNAALRIVRENERKIVEAWNEHFTGKP